MERVIRLEEVAYTEEPETSKELVFQRTGTGGNDHSLAGTSWTLAYLGEWHSLNSPISGPDVTIEFFEGGELLGNAGCNSYISNDFRADNSIFFSGVVGSTRKSCPNPSGIMEQEARFLELLSSAEFYAVSGNTLTLTVPGAVRDYVIRPSSEANELVVIRAKVGNHAANRVALDMEASRAELLMDSGRYHSVNTYEAGVPTDGFHAEKNVYIPFLRGSQELDKGFELDGWLIFDVPKGSVAQSFKWEAGGEIIIDMTYLSAPTPTPTTIGIDGGSIFVLQEI